MSPYLRIQLAFGLFLAIAGFVISYVLVVILVSSDPLKEMDYEQGINETIRLAYFEWWISRAGEFAVIVGGLIAFSAIVIWLLRPKKSA
jgi:hypothetical protein